MQTAQTVFEAAVVIGSKNSLTPVTEGSIVTQLQSTMKQT
jgi:hypothetical protein